MPNGNIYDIGGNSDYCGNSNRNNTPGGSCDSGGHRRGYYISIRRHNYWSCTIHTATSGHFPKTTIKH